MAESMKMKSCKSCHIGFIPSRPLQTVCGPACAHEFAAAKSAKAAKRAAAQDRRNTKTKLDAMKTLGKLLAEAQKAFNRYIRARDAGLPCICCGKPMGPNIPGGSVDAGHYRSRGSAPHLRFDERNCHAQLKKCNRFDSGNPVGYRRGLIERIGLAGVEILEADQEPRRFRRDDLISIKREYDARALVLEKLNEGRFRG